MKKSLFGLFSAVVLAIAGTGCITTVDGHKSAGVPFRKDHLAHARAAVERGELVLGGALANPVDGTVLLFKGDSPAAAEIPSAASQPAAMAETGPAAVQPDPVIVPPAEPVTSIHVIERILRHRLTGRTAGMKKVRKFAC